MSEDREPSNGIHFKDDSINIRQEIERYLPYWKWFLVSLIIALSIAYFYARYTSKQYKVTATILINNGENSGVGSELTAFKDLGIPGGSEISIENEIELLKSRSLMQKVVKKLELNVTLYEKGRVKTNELFKGDKSPILIKFFNKNDAFYARDTSFSIELLPDYKFNLYNQQEEFVETKNFGEDIQTSLGSMTITPNAFSAIDVGRKLFVRVSNLNSVVSIYRSKLLVETDGISSVLKLSMIDHLIPKAKEILDNLITIYNNSAVDYKSQVSIKTDKFITERIKNISEELEAVEGNVANFKRENKVTDISIETGIILNSNSAIEQKIFDLSTQLKMVSYFEEYLESNDNELIPVNLGIDDSALSKGSSRYNELLAERKRISQSSSDLNPVIVNLDRQLQGIKDNIQKSLEGLKKSLKISLQQIKNQESRINSKISSVPSQEKEYREIQREQQIIEGLYLYLLKKREENAITLAGTMPNSKIIDKAYSNNVSIYPNTRVIYLGALAIGFLIPFVFLYIKFLINNKIETIEDVEENLKAPILGDIPKSKSKHDLVIHSEAEDGSFAEAFRMIRTNIYFKLKKTEGEGKVIFVSSTIAGEGKTVISINLASNMSFSKNKVLLIGGDIRKPMIESYLGLHPQKGLTNYLNDTSIKESDVIQKSMNRNFDFLPSGTLVLNPSELLMSPRIDELLAFAKQRYDFVIIDTAPVNLVTDTLILSKGRSDLFVYVIRANYLDKRLLKTPSKLYEEKRLENMAVVINETRPEYGYGYGYGYGNSKKKPTKA